MKLHGIFTLFLKYQIFQLSFFRNSLGGALNKAAAEKISNKIPQLIFLISVKIKLWIKV